ncbi:MAG: PDZ domain-containing protein [Anaerolineae bacterium]|nr:PDZ domain-containing protein [Anaerolineae bacterium]
MLITLLAFASARPLNVQADVRQTSVPTTQATENAEPTATPTLTAPCPELPPLTVTAEPTDAVEATPFVGEPGYLGIAGENSSDGCGVTVVDLDPDGPAVQAGVKLNDMIYGAASLETRTVEKLKALIKSLPADSVVPLYIIRSKQPIVIRVTLASFADSHAAITPTSLPTATATAEATTEPTTQATLDATSEPTQPATETVAPPSASEGTPTN